MLPLREGLVVLGAMLASVVVACGGDSKQNDFGNDDDGGESGSASGGRGGSSGSGTTSGGASGSSGTSSGAAGSAGASGSAGSAAGGASGSAGAGGGRGYRPPDRQLAGCTRLCELERAAMCPAETTFEKCVEDCHIGIIFEVCSEAWDAVFACTGVAGSAECNAEDEATVPDCEDEGDAAITCVLTDGITDDLAMPCAAACVTSVAAMCPNGDEAACNFRCGILASGFPVCSGIFQTYAECSAEAEYICDEEGVPEPVGCATEFGAFVDCLAAEYAWQPGRGIVP